MTQEQTLQHLVDRLAADPRCTPDHRLIFADALDELAAHQATAPMHFGDVDHTRALATRLRHAVRPEEPA